MSVKWSYYALCTGGDPPKNTAEFFFRFGFALWSLLCIETISTTQVKAEFTAKMWPDQSIVHCMCFSIKYTLQGIKQKCCVISCPLICNKSLCDLHLCQWQFCMLYPHRKARREMYWLQILYNSYIYIYI